MAGEVRALPAWMANTDQKVQEKEPSKSFRKRKASRSVFYCMDENELLEAAVSFLTGGDCGSITLPFDQKVEEEEEEEAAADSGIKKLEDAIATNETSESLTPVSESDLDISEVETLPYIDISLPERCKGQRFMSEELHGSSVDAGLRPEKAGVFSQTPKNVDKDDDLQFVREIFFTR